MSHSRRTFGQLGLVSCRLVLCAAVCGVLLHAGSPICCGGDKEEVEEYQPENWCWWHCFYFHRDGRPRFNNGLFYKTKDHRCRLPPYPPIYEPGFGYNQPCWRQMQVLPRCVTCEIIPQSPPRQDAELPPPVLPAPQTVPTTPPPPVPYEALPPIQQTRWETNLPVLLPLDDDDLPPSPSIRGSTKRPSGIPVRP